MIEDSMTMILLQNTVWMTLPKLLTPQSMTGQQKIV